MPQSAPVGRTIQPTVWIVSALSGAAACISIQGADFATKYAGACTTAPTAFAADVERDGPRVQAARAKLVEAVGDRSEDLHLCYEQALANTPRLQGQVLVRVTQGGLHVVENTTKYEPFACCVAAVVREAYPAPTAPIALEYPFTFKLMDVPNVARRSLQADFVATKVRPEGYELWLDGYMHGL